MDIVTLLDEWEKDSEIDRTNILDENLNISKLHAKYTRIMATNSVLAKKVTANYNEQKSIKTDYYKGDLNNKEDLEKYGFTEPWMKTSTSAGAQKYIDGDKELNTLLMRKANYEEIVKTCEYILKELNNRTWQFRNYNEYLRFTRGET